MKIQHLHKALLTFDDGTSKEVARIGKGRYTTAWKNCSAVYIQVAEIEYSKEILSGLDNVHIPKIKSLGWAEGNAPYRWYSMPLYHPMRAKHKEAWAQLKQLMEFREEAYRHFPYGSNPQACQINQIVDDLVQDATYLPESLKEAITLLSHEATNYGEYLFEFTKKNTAVDDNGTLILLDPLFDWDEVKAAHKKAIERHRGY